MSRSSAFKTPEGEAAFLAAYDAAMKLWPVPYEEMDIPTQFRVRGMLMMAVPTRFTVNSFMTWLGITGTSARLVRELMYLGLKHFRVPRETARVMPTVFSDDELRAMRVPMLLLIGNREVISDPAM